MKSRSHYLTIYSAIVDGLRRVILHHQCGLLLLATPSEWIPPSLRSKSITYPAHDRLQWIWFIGSIILVLLQTAQRGGNYWDVIESLHKQNKLEWVSWNFFLCLTFWLWFSRGVKKKVMSSTCSTQAFKMHNKWNLSSSYLWNTQERGSNPIKSNHYTDRTDRLLTMIILLQVLMTCHTLSIAKEYNANQVSQLKLIFATFTYRDRETLWRETVRRRYWSTFKVGGMIFINVYTFNAYDGYHFFLPDHDIGLAVIYHLIMSND